MRTRLCRPQRGLEKGPKILLAALGVPLACLEPQEPALQGHALDPVLRQRLFSWAGRGSSGFISTRTGTQSEASPRPRRLGLRSLLVDCVDDCVMLCGSHT